MITKEEIVAKIRELLTNLNNSFEHIADQDEVNALEHELFELNAIYFAEHTKILRKLVGNEEPEKSLSIDKTTDAPNELLQDEVQHSESSITENKPIIEETEEVKTQELVDNDPAEEKEHKEGSSLDLKEVPQSNKEEEVAQTPLKEEEKKQGAAPVSNTEFVRKEPEQESKAVVNEVVIEEKEFSFKSELEEATVAQPRSIADSYSSSQKISLNDRLLAQRQSALGVNQASGSMQRIKDIKSAINLNDKLLFIKDLFNGYSLAYSEALELLNRFETFAEADQFLQNNYADKNNWSSKRDTVDKFYAILQKRYA